MKLTDLKMADLSLVARIHDTLIKRLH